MNVNNFSQELSLLLKARYPIIYINTIEEDRVEFLIRKSFINRSIFTWDFVDGYTNNPNIDNFARRNPLQALEFIEKLTKETPGLILLKDFDRFLNDVTVSRKLKNLTRTLKLQPKTIIIISSEINIPLELRDFVTVINFDLPNSKEIESELLRLFDSLNFSIDNFLLDSLVKACQGLSLERIRRVLSKIIAIDQTITVDSIKIILDEKKQIISQTGILEYVTLNGTLENLGGIPNLKNWLKKRKSAFSLKASNYGLPLPRGLLLVGVQGTGKSLTAKVIGENWKLSFVKLDIGKLFGGIVGQSELQIRQTIKITESLAPCILWIDEIDKAFNTNEMNGDSGTSNRVLATLLTWLAEKTSTVFVVATANDIKNLPSELLRKGRFDEIFFLDLPNEIERKEIFEIHLKKVRPEIWKTFDSALLAKYSKKFSGAEIEQTIIDAMYLAFDQQREFTTSDILESIEDVIPLAKLNEEKLEELQNWAISGRIRRASSKT